MAFVKVVLTGTKDLLKAGFERFNTLIDDLVSTSSGKGASQIGVEDTAGNLEASNVEDALAEIYVDTETTRTLSEIFNENVNTTTGLTWGYKAGVIRYDNEITSVSANTVSLTDDATNYIEVRWDGEIIRNIVGFTAGRIPIRQVVTEDSVQITSIDKRGWFGAQLVPLPINKGGTGEITGRSMNVQPVDVLSTSMTRFDSDTLTIEGNETFTVGDILRMVSRVDDEWLEVMDADDAPTYTVTRDKAGVYGADSNPDWQKGTSVNNYQKSGDGGVFLTSDATNAPYISVFSHAGEPWDTLSTKVRLGNLNGFLGYSSDIYGIAIGETNKYLKYDPTNGLRIKGSITGSNITLDTSGYIRTSGKDNYADTTSGFFLGYDTDAYKFNLGNDTQYIKWDGTNLTIEGGISVNTITLDTDGYIRTTGKDNYADDTAGIFFGYDTDAYKLNIGNTDNYLKWDGAALNVKGLVSSDSLSTLNANIGAITAGTLSSSDWGAALGIRLDLGNKWLKMGGSDVTAAGAAAGVFLGLDTSYKFYVGDGSNKYLKWDGTNLTVRGITSVDVLSVINANMGTITAGSMSAARITSGTLNADRIGATSINAGKIVVGTLTATQIYAEAYLGGKRLDDYGSGCVNISSYATQTITHNLGRHAIVMGYLNDGVTYHAARIISHTDTSFGIYNWIGDTTSYCYSYI